eukprot:gnl/Chilomastix_cuspidata/3388.p1 GENE.gnl/Chilomastix_cuspidata/3388~~gnl/Chilomastix_cuspidata/3388.p1  ORF type:complete len:552 (+),score=127.00 gnl/Chilomastix_cuspidata/3388:222-1658(+)
MECIRMAARELGLCLEEPEAVLPKLTASDLSSAKAFAQKHKAKYRRKFEAALFALEAASRVEPARTGAAPQAVSASRRLREKEMKGLCALSSRSRLEKTQETLGGITGACGEVLLDAESEARAAAVRARGLENKQRVSDATQVGAKCLRLEAVAAFEGVPSSTLAARLVRDTAAETCGSAESVGSFEAFLGARDLPYVKALLARPVRAWHGLGVSTSSVEVPGTPRHEMKRVVSFLGTDGTLCIKYNGAAEGDGCLCLCSLLTTRTVAFKVPNIAWACVFNGSLYVGVDDVAEVFFAPLASVFAAPSFAAFRSFPLPGRIRWAAAMDRAHKGRVVALFRPSAFIAVNLKKRSGRIIEHTPRLYSINSLSGIRVSGALGCARMLDKKAAVIVFKDGRTEEISQNCGNLPMLLPSATHPRDFLRAAIFGLSEIVSFQGRDARLVDPIQPNFLSLVRLYRDVFLCQCAKTFRWHVLRISVP